MQTFRMPKFLTLLFFVEMWERFSYYGMRALLVLFLTSSFGFSDPKAYAIYSLFAALGYAGPVIGGFLADQLMGFRNMVFLGGVLMSIGHAMLAFVNFDPFLLYLGLGFIAVGTGMFKGNISNLLGCCYSKDDPERDRGFVLFYVSVNLGSLLASISCGYVAHRYGWHYGFGLAGLGMLAGLLTFMRYQSILGDKGLAPKPEVLTKPLLLPGLNWFRVVALGCVAVAYMSAFLLQASDLFTQLLSFFGVGILAALGVIVSRANKNERRNIMILVILMVFYTCFFALEMQLGSLINLFAERNVNKMIFGFEVPASFSQAINPFSIIVFGPVLSGVFMHFGNRWAMLRYGLGLATMVVCFLILYLSAFQANEQGQVPYIYLFVSIAFMGVGELGIAPLIQSFCTILAPARIRGFMMGVLLLSASYANLAGILISKFMSVPKAADGQAADAFASLAIYQAGFYQIMLFNVALVVAFMLLYPFLNRVCRVQIGGAMAAQAASTGEAQALAFAVEAKK